MDRDAEILEWLRDAAYAAGQHGDVRVTPLGIKLSQSQPMQGGGARESAHIVVLAELEHCKANSFPNAWARTRQALQGDTTDD